MTDGVDRTADEVPAAADDELAPDAGGNRHDTPDLAPFPQQARSPGRGRRRLIVGRNPGGIILPLALVSLVIYLLSTGWFNPPRSAKLQPPIDTTPTASSETAPPPTPTIQATPPAVLVIHKPNLEERLAEAADLTAQSRFEQAVEIYAELARELPDDPRPEAGWAWALLLDQRAEQALPHAHRAMALDPVNPDMATVLARVYLELGDSDRALGMAQGAVESGTGHAGAHAVLAEAYLLNLDLDRAAEEARRALQLGADNPESHRAQARLYEVGDDDLERAIEQLQAGAGLQPRLWLWHYELGQVLLRAEDYGQAIAALKKALALRPKAVILAAIGEAYYHLGQDREATTYLEQSLAAGGREAVSYALLAVVQARQNRCVDAQTYYQTILAQDPGNALAGEARELCEGRTTTAVAEVVPATATPRATGSPPLPPLAGQIAFPAWNYAQERYDVHVVDLASGTERLVLEGVHQPALSPDGRWLAGNGERSLLMNLVLAQTGDGILHEITSNIEDSLPDWSPDGQSLVFSSNRHSDRQSRVYVVDQVSWDARVEGRVLRSDLYEVLGSYPAWAADGQVVYSGCDYRVSPIRCGLFALSATPGEQMPQQLTSHPDDSAPDIHGNRLAFMSRRDGNWEVYVAALDGSGLLRLTDNQANDGLPTWSPDGQAIAFVSDRGGVWAVWVMSPDGSNRRKILDIGGGGLLLDWQHERISWAP